MAHRIAPSQDGQELTPPTGGAWLRDADGGLTPQDEQTAVGAGLDWPAPEPITQAAKKAPKE